MTNSEQLLSAFSENFFFKELVIDRLHFTPEGSSEKELADLLINLGDIIIAIQLKERNPKHQTNDTEQELRWLEKKCKAAKYQVKESLSFIKAGKLPVFKNKKEQSIILNPDAEMIPVVIFKNDLIIDYPHLLKKHSEDGISINCMSFDDYEKMCRMLSTPIEIVEYLKYRKTFLEKDTEVSYSFYIAKEEVVITKPNKREALVMQFLAEKYGLEEAEKHILNMTNFRYFISEMQDHIIEVSEKNGSFDLLKFFAHLNRYEISTFLSQLDSAKFKAYKGNKGILHSLRRGDGEYAILFVAEKAIPIENLKIVVNDISKKEIKCLLEIVINWISDEEYELDFCLF